MTIYTTQASLLDHLYKALQVRQIHEIRAGIWDRRTFMLRTVLPHLNWRHGQVKALAA